MAIIVFLFLLFLFSFFAAPRQYKLAVRGLEVAPDAWLQRPSRILNRIRTVCLELVLNVSLYGDTKRAKASTYIYMIHDNPVQNNVPIRLA